MDAKALYPNFHAEVHRYNAASVPTKHTLGSTRSAGAVNNNSSRPRSTTGAMLRKSSSGGGRPSTSPSPQTQVRSSRSRPETNQPAPTTTVRRRVLPPCVPSRANRYATTTTDTKLVVAQKAIARQRSFCRIQDCADPSDDDASSSNDGDANVDDGGEEEAIPECAGDHVAPSAREPVASCDSSDDSNMSRRSSSLAANGSNSLLCSSSDNLHELVINARPRSRYARREHPRQSGRALDRITSAPPTTPASSALLASVQSAPVFASAASPTLHELTRNKSASAILGRDDLHSHGSAGAKLSAAAPTLWRDDELSGFFLTEVDAKSVESQRRLARSVARGSFMLYGACDFASAAGHLSQALELAYRVGGDGLVALLQHHLGIALKEDGKLKWAEAMQEKALLSAQRAGETRMRGRALKALGVICMELHDLAKALDCQQEALALAERDTELEARVYANLGNIASAHMQFGHALSCHKRDLRLSSLALAESAVGQLRAHRNLALVYAKLGRGELQAQHEHKAARWENAFAHDMKTHPRDAIGNIYMQLATRDATLQELIASSILEIVSECDAPAVGGDSSASSGSAADDAVLTPVIRPVLVKQVLITRASGGFSPMTRSRSMTLGNSSSLKRLA